MMNERNNNNQLLRRWETMGGNGAMCHLEGGEPQMSRKGEEAEVDERMRGEAWSWGWVEADERTVGSWEGG